MNNKTLLYGMLLAGLSLGTAWAIRGQFGHEQGAAWAGAIGCLSIILLAKREDWYQRAFPITLSGAIGWGIGGIMSYGQVVGYGRDDEFVNVYYGFTMLFVIGGLYGYLGGGLFGLALSDEPGTKTGGVKWNYLLVEMTAGAILFYFFLIEQFGWLMTPPRSELWAACLGAGVLLTWYLLRNRHYPALRVAVFSGLGAGFGFAFGNFLQVLGQVSGVSFNFWNVMEYSLGFFGGAGMAYGTFTSRWEKTGVPLPRQDSLLPLLGIALVIPFIVWDQSFETERLTETFLNIGAAVGTGTAVKWAALVSILFLSVIWIYKFLSAGSRYTYSDILIFFLGHFALYILLSLLITGAFLSTYRIEQYLYPLNYILIALLIGRVTMEFSDHGLQVRRWGAGVLVIGIVIALLAFIAISTHDELPNSHKRFPTVPTQS